MTSTRFQRYNVRFESLLITEATWWENYRELQIIEDSRKETKNSYYLDDYVDGQANTEDCYISIVYDGLGDGPAGRPDQFEPYLYPLLLAGGGNTYNKYLSLANNYGIFSPLPQEK